MPYVDTFDDYDEGDWSDVDDAPTLESSTVDKATVDDIMQFERMESM